MDPRRHGRPVGIAQADEIPHGSPIEVLLPHRGYVRGVHLGVIALPTSDTTQTKLALRLGVLGVIVLYSALASILRGPWI